MRITNNSSLQVKVAIYNGHDLIQTDPLPGGVLKLNSGSSSTFNATRRVRVKFFVPAIFDQFITDVLADPTQDVTLQSNRRAAVSGRASGSSPEKELAAEIGRVVSSTVFAREIREAQAAVADPGNQRRVKSAFARDLQRVEGIMQKRATDIGWLMRSKESANFKQAVASGDRARISSSGAAVRQTSAYNSLNQNIGKALGFSTVATAFSFSGAAVVGLGVSFGEAEWSNPQAALAESSEKRYFLSFGGSGGWQFGAGVDLELWWFQARPSDLGGWSLVIGAKLGLTITGGILFSYSFDPFGITGFAILPGIGAAVEAGIGVGYDWVL